MNGRATTTVSIYRGSTQDAYGDPVDDNTVAPPIATGVICSIIEQTRRAFIAAESRRTVVKNAFGRVVSGTDVIEGDRIKDERTGEFYFVEATSMPQSPFGAMDVRLVLRTVAQPATP